MFKRSTGVSAKKPILAACCSAFAFLPARMLQADIVFGGVCLCVSLPVRLSTQNLENY